MNWLKVNTIILLGCTLLIIYLGQHHWDQKLQQVATNSNLVFEKYPLNEDRQQLVENENVSISKLVIDYEEKFSEIIISYQQDVKQLLERAEIEYYNSSFEEQTHFRQFVSYYMKEVDAIYENAKLQYQLVYNDFSRDLNDYGYEYNDTFIYFIVFEEMTMETHTAFVTQLISLQN